MSAVHQPHAEELDPTCERCQELRIQDLGPNFLMQVLGLTPQEFEALTDPTTRERLDAGPLAHGVACHELLWIFRYAIRKANALQIMAEVEELKRIGKFVSFDKIIHTLV